MFLKKDYVNLRQKTQALFRIIKVMIVKNTLRTVVLSLLAILFFTPVKASGNSDEEFDVRETIMHHIKDAHEWHITNSLVIPLPIILIDNGLTTFSSADFHHGETITTSTGEEYVKGSGKAASYAIYHEKIYKLNENGELSFKDGHPEAEAPVDLSITRNVVHLFTGALLLLLIGFSVGSYYKKNGAVAPKGLSKFMEPLIIFVRDEIAKANINEHKYQKYVPYLLTIFFFILINNLIGLVPVLGANLTGSISVTLVLASFTLLATVFSGNKNYWKHIFATPGVPVPLLIIMIPIELVGVLTKPFALMIRLFANITAGHIIILALVSIIFINKNAGWAGLSVPMALFISVLEILVAFLQAYLFAMLSALYIGGAVEEDHH